VADIVDSTRLAAEMGDRRWHRVLVEHQEVVRQQLVRLLGDDIGGIAVHIAARVMAAAGAGEIVCSRTVKDLVAGAGYAFADRGTRTLKGVPDSWQLYAVELAER
jgi:class 3 adenylate cyclase